MHHPTPALGRDLHRPEEVVVDHQRAVRHEGL
jgi:hypothetical protein